MCPADWGGAGRAGGRWPHSPVLTVAWVVTRPALKQILARYTESRWVPMMVSSEPLQRQGSGSPGCTWSPGDLQFPAPHPVQPGQWEDRVGPSPRGREPTHSLIAAAGNDGGYSGVRAVLEGHGSRELLPVDPQGYPGCAQATSGGSRASDCPIALTGHTAGVAGGTAGLQGLPVPRAGDPSVPGGGRAELYLGCPSRAHSEPLTITRQLLPAERCLPWSERWVPPPRGPNGGCRALTWGS